MENTQISHYRVLRRIGGGGMGVVYAAEDLKLGRTVALKFLPDETEHDPQALDRLLREARAASALNHPNICTVFEVNEHEGRHFIAMELVEGTPLDQRINARPLPLAQLLDLAEQIADALDAAHIKGVIHRDIKPGNILVTAGNRVKVVDFGLAKMGEADRRKTLATSAATAGVSQANLTSPGVALGTVAYMSPEQARGEPLDARTDLFSFGAVLYEMATGTLPFQGATSAVIFDAILNRDPAPPSRLNPVAPVELERIIHKALEKDRDLRYQAAAEMRADLRRLKRDSESKRVSVVATPVAAIAPARRRPPWLMVSLALLVVIIAAAAYLVWRNRPPQLAPQSQWTQLTDYSDGAVSPSFSPDGKLLTFLRGDSPFTTDGNVYVKLLPDGDPVQLTHDDQTKMDPVFTPDGSRITYTGITQFDWQMWEVPVFGGEPRLVLHNAAAAHWLGPHELMFSEIESGVHMAVATASESRGNHRTIYSPSIARGMAHRSYVSPDGKSVLVAEMDSPEWLPCRVVPFDGSGAGQRVGPPTGHCLSGTWSPDGKWIYFTTDADSNGTHLWRQRFPTGTPEQLTFGPTEEEGVAVSPDGKYLVTSVGSDDSTVWLHEGQKQTQLSSEGWAFSASMSPDAKTAYFLTIRRGRANEHPSALPGGEEAGGTGEFTAVDLNDQTTHRLFPDLNVRSYSISPDSKTAALIVRAGSTTQLWIAPLDQRSEPRQVRGVIADKIMFLSNTELLCRTSEERVHHFYRMNVDGSNRREVFTQGDVVGTQSCSPDRKWISLWMAVKESDNTTAVDAYNVEDGRRVRVCTACQLHWTGDGKYLILDYFFLARRRVGRAAQATAWAVPTVPGTMLPANLPANGWTLEEVANLKGAVPLNFIPADGSTLDRTLTVHQRTQRNLFRIPLQ
jgi:serine/threonine protein kinase